MVTKRRGRSAENRNPDRANSPRHSERSGKSEATTFRAFFAALLLATSAFAGVSLPDEGLDDDDGDVNALKRMSLEDLIGVEVTIASKSPKKLSDVAAAVFVITADDIARSGATTIPGVLRMVPGMQVSRVDNRNWAVGIRGFNGRFSNKLLVQIDGRSVYTPLFSGVFWDVQHVVLEDIDRIEVIRGPGATLWGANAVNGIVNIITKSSRDTGGTFVEVGSGDSEVASAAFRYGGSFGSSVNYRFSATYHDRDTPLDIDAPRAANDWRVGQASFRFDWGDAAADSFVLQGDAYDSTVRGTDVSFSLTPPYAVRENGSIPASGGNTLFRWTRSYSDSSDSQLQVYYDVAKRSEVSFTELNAQVMDIDWQHQFAPGRSHRLVWGLGHRLTQTEVSIAPEEQADHLWSTFVQDEMRIGERLQLTLGTKLEHNPYTGFEFQPSARMLFKPSDSSAIWGAASRAVRTPTRLEHDAQVVSRVIEPLSEQNPTPFPVLVQFAGDPRFVSEDAVTYEAGYRNMIGPRLSLDFASFYSDYRNLRTLEIELPVFNVGPNTPPHLDVRSVTANNLEGTTYGAELALDFQPTEWWRLRSTYGYLRMDLQAMPESNDPISDIAEGQAPSHQLSVRSSFDIRDDVFVDGWLRFVDELPTALPGVRVPSYTTFDLRLAWRAHERVELSLIGHDLLSAHGEFGSEFFGVDVAEVGPELFLRLKWQF